MVLFLFKILFKLKGWRLEGGMPKEIKKCVLVAAPHTSNWDFVYGLAAADLFGVKFKYLIKKELFKFPIKGILYRTGGVPVERKKNSSLVESFIDVFNKHENFVVLFPPEGTRSRVEQWKSGFYQTAIGAKVPIVLGYLDYEKKVACIGKSFMPSGNEEEDFKIIYDFYKDRKGHSNSKFNAEAILQTAKKMQEAKAA